MTNLEPMPQDTRPFTPQATMRQSYADGGPGVIISGAVWTLSAITIIAISHFWGMAVLFFGGMAIFPLSTLIDKRIKKIDIKPSKALSRLAVLTLLLLFGGLWLGYSLSVKRPELFFAVTAMAIGIRYLIFERIYGLKAFWILGAILIGWGLLGAFMPRIGSFETALLVGITELGIGLWLTRRFIARTT